MREAITLEGVLAFLTLATVLAGFWWRIDARMRSVEKDLAAFKLEAAEKYASVEHLKEVEVRLVTSIDRLADRIDRMLSRFDPAP